MASNSVLRAGTHEKLSGVKVSVPFDLRAADIYPTWKRMIRDAASSVRVYTPYLDRLIVDLLGNAIVGDSALSVVTDLSPASGTTYYRPQLLAVKRLIEKGVEVRSLARLHAKVLLVDDGRVALGSQNFTSYARRSRETSAALEEPVTGSVFVRILQHWYDQAEIVDVSLVDRLLEETAEPLEQATAAIAALVATHEKIVEAQRIEAQRAATSRFERDLAAAASGSHEDEIRRAAESSAYVAGQDTAYAKREWQEEGYESLVRWNRDIDLTRWRTSSFGQSVQLDRLAFYPVLLGPEGRMAFVRVAKSRITYVWRGVRWGTSHQVAGRSVFLRTSFPDRQHDDANLVITIGWRPGAESGYQFRLRFDGTKVLPVASGALVGDVGVGAATLAEIAAGAYEDAGAWDDMLREVFSPAHYPSGFLKEKNAATFFPSGWLRIDHTKFLEQSVLVVQPHP